MPRLQYDRLQVFRVGKTDEYWRILWVDAPKGVAVRYVFIQLHGPYRMPIWINAEDLADRVVSLEWNPVDENPFKFAYRSEHDLPSDPQKRQKYIDIKCFKLKCIRQILSIGRDAYIGHPRQAEISRLVENQGKQVSIDEAQVRHWLILFWRSGDDSACFFPRYCRRGRKAIARELESTRTQLIKKRGPKAKKTDANGAWGCDLDVNDWENLKRGAREFLFVPGRHLTSGRHLAWTTAHKSTLAKYFITTCHKERDAHGNLITVQLKRPPERWPNLSQFKTAAHCDLELEKRIKAVEGERAYNTKFRPMPGSSLDIAEGPGAIFQVDWMRAKIWLANRVDRTACGMPYVYFVTDTFSRMIVGVYVTFEYPTYRTAAMALLEAMSNKVTFAARFGVQLRPEDWPCHHIPDQILHDGGELASTLSDLVPMDVADLATAPAYRPELKAIVEKRFGLAGFGLIEWQIGADVRDTPADAPDPKHLSGLTLQEFTAQLIRWVVFEHNQKWIRKLDQTVEGLIEGIDPIPLKLWNWAIPRIWGRLRRKCRSELIPKLMPRAEARATQRGIEFKGVRYYADTELIRSLCHRASISASDTTVRVAYDDNNTNEIHLVNPKLPSSFETVPIVQSSPYANRTFVEVFRQKRAEEERRVYEQAIAGVRGVEEERKRQEEEKRITTAKVALEASSLISTHPALTPTETKAEEVRTHQEEERSQNTSTSMTKESLNEPPKTNINISAKPVASRVLRLLMSKSPKS